MILIYGAPRKWQSLSSDKVKALSETHRTIQSELSKSKELLDHKELKVDNIKFIEEKNGNVVVRSSDTNPEVRRKDICNY